MSRIQEAFEAVRALALAAQSEYDRITVGALPPEDGLCMAISTGTSTGETLGKDGRIKLYSVVNCKNSDQKTALETLCAIHEALCAENDLPGDDGWQISRISTTGAPSYIGMDGDQYLYGSSIEIILECEEYEQSHEAPAP